MLAIVVVLMTSRGRIWIATACVISKGRATVEERLAQCGPAARARLAPAFGRTGLSYPPARLALIADKEARSLQIYASAQRDMPEWRYLADYPILGSSGTLGPKLAEGDRQVPEGVYRIESLNPNARFHLALRVNYPNDIDQARAKLDGRTNLGGDIMIHGGSASIGCLAMGDRSIEELFVLAADVGIDNIVVVIAPRDLRVTRRPELPDQPAWVNDMYDEIEAALRPIALPRTWNVNKGK